MKLGSKQVPPGIKTMEEVLSDERKRLWETLNKSMEEVREIKTKIQRLEDIIYMSLYYGKDLPRPDPQRSAVD